MNSPAAYTVNRNIPGMCAAFTEGRGADAHLLARAALADTPPDLVVMQLWQYLTHGWVLFLEERCGLSPALDDLEDWWTEYATVTIASDALDND